MKVITSFAKDFLSSQVGYGFSDRETLVLDLFFTNTDRKVFFIRPALPTSVSGALISMYSRMKNQRGIRGHFVDNLLPLILLSFTSLFRDQKDDEEVGNTVRKMQKFLSENHIRSLDEFCAFSFPLEKAFSEFFASASYDVNYMEKIASSPKTKHFFKLFLDSYGHNSIARTTSFTL